MEINSVRIAHIHKDQDALTIMFEDGRRMLFTGTQTQIAHPVIPEFIVLELEHLDDFDC
jgi:hypothetical protein